MSNSLPLVTAVCPTYNRPAWAYHAAELFLQQTWARSEMIVLDDSDRDHQVELPKSPRIKHVRLPAHITTGEKHELGHQHGQGDVFAYWDDDDWFHPRRFVRQLQPIVLGQASIVGCLREYILQVPGPTWWRFNSGYGLDFKRWGGNAIGGFRLSIHDGTALYAREVLRGGAKHSPTTIGQKVVFLNQLVEQKFRYKCIPNQGMFVYVRHGTNTWQFREDLRLVRASKPMWFNEEMLGFYRDVA